MGNPTYICKACDVKLWRGEATKGRGALYKKDAFSLCCMTGKVELPKLKDPPHTLSEMYNGRSQRSRKFIKYIRQFNMMFSFTSMGGKIDNRYNKGRGPYCYRINGQNYHTVGSLLPEEGEIAKFLQLYIYDTAHEVENRLNHHSSSLAKSIKNPESMEYFIVLELKGLLDEINP